MPIDDPADEEVGYGKPPKATQWKPGQSGNPKGKVKGTKSLKTVLEKEATGRVVVKEGGKTRTLTKLEAVVMSLSNKALHGDVKAITQLIALWKEHLPAESAAPQATLTPEDLAILNNHAKLLALIGGEDSDGSE
jgi:hypothetical protein